MGTTKMFACGRVKNGEIITFTACGDKIVKHSRQVSNRQKKTSKDDDIMLFVNLVQKNKKD